MLLGLARLWRFREVVHVLIDRELKARYRGAALGFLWSLLNPLIFMAVYVLVFSVYMRIGVEHYPAFLLSGLLPWMWFSASVTESSRSIIDNRGLVRKVALPSEIFPLVAIGANLIHLLISLPVLLALLLGFGIVPSWATAFFPLVLLIQFLLTLGLGLMCAALAVRFRDLLQLVPNLLTIWLFLTPVFYPPSMVPPALRPLVLANPMALLVSAYQDILFYRRAPSMLGLGLAATVAVGLLLLGYTVFNARREVFVEDI